MKKFFKDNLTIFIYAATAFALECFGIIFTGGFPFVTNPLYILSLIIFFCTVLFFIKNKPVQFFVTLFLLLVQLFIISGFVFLYDANGTYFDWSMVNQRSDAAGTIEDFNLNMDFLIPAIAALTVYASYMGKYAFKNKTKYEYPSKFNKVSKITAGVLSVIMLLSASAFPIVRTAKAYSDDYTTKLYNESYSRYQQYGITGNAIYQMFSGVFSKGISVTDLSDVNAFIYKDQLAQSSYFGTSEGNNLILILAESFEWYPLFTYSEDISKQLFPNLFKYFIDTASASNNGVIMDSFYAREKTDTAEILSLVGNYPTEKYVHYDFYKNEYPFSLPNLFRDDSLERGLSLQETQIKSYHQGYGDFYNRYTTHKQIGFDEMLAIEEMKAFGLTDTWNHKTGERNLDSLTIEAMKDDMFKDDGTRFFSFWITFSMHGFYQERTNLGDYYMTMDNLNAFPKTNSVKSNYVRTYAAALMDMDKSIGIMMEDLESKDLLANTTIAIYGDHNTYYSNLSMYAKNITSKFNSELYRIPFMIYDEKLTDAITVAEDTRKVSTFSTTADIIPTLMDLLGISGWKNLYFGSSVFATKQGKSEESIVYSRAYGIFLTDKLMCYSILNLLYTSPGFTKADKSSFELRAKVHLTKLKYTDKVYYSNYFKTNVYVPA